MQEYFNCLCDWLEGEVELYAISELKEKMRNESEDGEFEQING